VSRRLLADRRRFSASNQQEFTMNIPDFTIDLGNGIYLDSSGRLTGAIPDNVAKFVPSLPLPIPKEAIQDVFGVIGSVVPQMEKVAGVLQVKDGELFEALGLSQELIDTFGKVGNIAGTLASAIPYVNIAVGLLSALGAFGGSDPLAELVKKEFDRLHARLDEQARIDLNNYIASYLSVFDPALNAVANYRSVVAKPKKYQGPDELEQKRKDAADKVSGVHQKLTEALLHTWALPFSPIDYHDNWGYLQDILHTVPNSGTATPAHIPGAALPFDHRPMVQMLAYGIQVYLTLIKTVIPEHRTTGQYHEALRSAADKLSDKLDKMRAETLARTIYNPGVPFFKTGPRQWFVLPVGAMDLRADTDDYMRNNPKPADHPLWNRAGNLYRWWTLEPGNQNRGSHVEVDGDDWWTINPAAVEAANRQSERDYAAVLARSGYFTLAHLEALMRHLSTEPDRSETVTATAQTLRTPLAASTVPVKNDRIPFSPAIEASASREPQQCKAYITLTTQPIPNDSAIGYRVRLLTLPDGTTETPFDWYVWTTYGPDGSRNRKLEVHVNEGMPLDPVGNNERLLVEGISPAQRLVRGDTITLTATLTADTFDWYIPKPDSPIAFERIKDLIQFGVVASPGTGTGAQPIPLPPSPPGGSGTAGQPWNMAVVATNVEMGVKAFGWDEGQQTWNGQKREWRRTQIKIDYELDWHEDQLNIVLKARPEDRNYVVYLVVEEYLTRSQQYLRTAVQIRFNGQLTYVPQSFFEEEEKAENRAKGILTRIEKNYSISRQPGPADPVVGWLRPGILETAEGMQEFMNAARRHAPDVVERTLAEVGGVTSA
jgi:hypothetical protein